MQKRSFYILILILLLAGFLRFYKLAEYPVGFHIDEASLGYNAYSLLKTGRDENGQFLPLHIDMFGDFRPAGYQYLDILPVWLFGLNEFATRLPSALFGTLTVLSVYYLVNELFISELKGEKKLVNSLTRNKLIALAASFFLAISPWHIVISRASAETIVALFFIILGAYFFLSGIRGKGKRFLWATGCFLASLFFYHSSRVFVPLLVLAFWVIHLRGGRHGRHLLNPKARIRKYHSNSKMNSGIKNSTTPEVFRPFLSFLLVSLVALFLLFGTKGGAGRFRQVSIFHFPEIRLVLEEQIREDGITTTPLLLTRVFHNKVVNYGLGYLKEYFRYFSPNYLFIEGGLPLWYVVHHMGLMYLIELPFLLVGLYQLVRKGMKKRVFLIPVVWLILGPTIAAVTRDDVPNVQRSLVMLPALMMITAYGFWTVWEWVRIKRLMVLVLIVAFGWNFSYFLHQYFIHGRVHRPWYRFNGFKEMVLAVDELSSDFDKVIVSKTQGGTYMHFLFFQKINPEWYQKLGSPRDQDYGGFGKLIFVPQDCPDSSFGSGGKVLYVARGTCEEGVFASDEARLIKREDGTVAFRIYPSTRKPSSSDGE